MARVTRKEVQATFRHWLSVIGHHEATSFHDVGAYRLDQNSSYGGWRIERIVNQHGGVSEVNYGRMPGQQFINAMHFACASIGESQRNARTDSEEAL